MYMWNDEDPIDEDPMMQLIFGVETTVMTIFSSGTRIRCLHFLASTVSNFSWDVGSNLYCLGILPVDCHTRSCVYIGALQWLAENQGTKVIYRNRSTCRQISQEITID